MSFNATMTRDANGKYTTWYSSAGAKEKVNAVTHESKGEAKQRIVDAMDEYIKWHEDNDREWDK